MKVRLENVTKMFNETVAVKNVTLDIKDGKLTGLLGPSGCGKSTTLYLICGLTQPTSGKIYFEGKDVTDLDPEERGVGLVFQNYALYPHMTILQNIMFPLENQKIPKKIARERAMEMAKLTRVDGLVNRKPSQLSGGQQQRVAVARALVKKPRVLLLDEPLSNLDARLRIEMREEIRRIQVETGITTVFVTHDQEEAMMITDDVVLMKDGEFLQQCPPQHMYLHPVNLFVASFLGNPPINIVSGSVRDGYMILKGQQPYKLENIPDGDYRFGFRPEWFTEGTDFTFTLENVSNHGRDQIAEFEFAESPAKALIDSIHFLRSGMRVSFSLKKDMFYVFDENGIEVRRKGL